MPTDPPGPDVIEQAVADALQVTERSIGRSDPDDYDPDHTAMRAACFAEVLRARLAYEYQAGQAP